MTSNQSDQNDLPAGEGRFRRKTGSRRIDPSTHPAPDELLAYHERRLPPKEDDRVQEHLVRCEECARVVLDFKAFPDLEPPDEARRLSEADVETQWRALERKLAEHGRPLWRRARVGLPLAAVFFLAALGLGFWNVALHQKIAVLDGPRGDVHILADLRPAEGNVSRGAEKQTDVPAWARRLVVLLNLPTGEGAGYQHFEVDVSSEEGPVFTAVPVRRNPSGGFTVDVPRRKLSRGRHVIELYGLEGGSRTLIAEYSVVVGDDSR
jgi:anti-sigma factor RsiW